MFAFETYLLCFDTVFAKFEDVHKALLLCQQTTLSWIHCTLVFQLSLTKYKAHKVPSKMEVECRVVGRPPNITLQIVEDTTLKLDFGVISALKDITLQLMLANTAFQLWYDSKMAFGLGFRHHI